MSALKSEPMDTANHLFLEDQQTANHGFPKDLGVQPLKFGQRFWIGTENPEDLNQPRVQKRSESFNVQATDRSIDSPMLSQGKAAATKFSYKKESRNSVSTQAFDNPQQTRATHQQLSMQRVLSTGIPTGYCHTLDGLLYRSRDATADENNFYLFYSWEQNFLASLGGLECPCVLMFFPSGGFFFGQVDASNVADGPGLLRLPLLKTDVLGTWRKGRICGKAWVKTDKSRQIGALFQGNRLQSYITESEPRSDDFLFENCQTLSGRNSLFTSTPPKDGAESPSSGRIFT